MSMQRRYTIFNLYIRGGNQSPQACHALNNLWKARNSMSIGAVSLFDNWANNSEIEIMLQGGYHEDLETLYRALSQVKDLPCAKFNESAEALNEACTVVTFVASERIVAANNYIRKNRLTPANVRGKLGLASLEDLLIESPLTDEEIFVLSKFAFLPLSS